ncbi:hypothetical protein FQN54_005708 [Arachnomyces sp. PD_36]|nr:hypothetical protein FQN54_005708 [Arachnomyces sp. PD_36]
MPRSCFSSLPEAVTDEIFDLFGAFRADTHPNRVNLAPGIYYTDEGESWPPNVVCQAEKKLYEKADNTRHDYLPIAGDQEFLKVARELAFTPQAADKGHIVSVQTISGTGANHIGARFLIEHLQPQNVWLSDPTWANHHTIWESVGVSPRLYPYYKKSDCSFDFDGMIEALEAHAQPRDILVLHACAHNPTGLDPSKGQWIAIADLCQRKGVFPFFDAAYLGFASGDPAEDAWAIRYFNGLQPQLEMVVAQSFSKNFGLYGHRTGALHLVLAEASAKIKENADANLCHLLRSEFSMAPKYGSTIVKTVLHSEELTAVWMDDLKIMSNRIKSMRRALYDELVRLGTPGSWKHIIDQIGMFSYSGLTPPEVDLLRKESHVYLLKSGRISISGLNSKNVGYVAKAIYDARTKLGHHIEPNGVNGVNGVNGAK